MMAFEKLRRLNRRINRAVDKHRKKDDLPQWARELLAGDVPESTISSFGIPSIMDMIPRMSDVPDYYRRRVTMPVFDRDIRIEDEREYSIRYSAFSAGRPGVVYGWISNIARLLCHWRYNHD